MSLQLPGIIEQKLRQFERNRKLLFALRGTAETVLGFCGGLMVIALMEWATKPNLTARLWVSGLLYSASFGFLFWRVVFPLARSRSLRAVAWDFETAARLQFHERILAAVELAEQPEVPKGVSRWMTERTMALAAEEIGSMDPATLAERRPVWTAWRTAFSVFVGLAVLCLIPRIGPRVFLVLNPYASTARLSRVQLAITPGHCHIAQGTALDIRALGPNLPEEAKVVIKWDDGFQETVAMSRSQTNEFLLTLSAVSKGFQYLVQAGDAESDFFKVKVDVPPRVSAIRVRIEPPNYSRSPNRVVEGGTADFLAGSRLHVEIETADEKVNDAEWVSDAAPTRKLRALNERLLLDLEPTNQLNYQVRLVGENGLHSESQRWSLRPLVDDPPQAKLAIVGSDPGMVQPDEVLPLQASASDDVGLESVDLLVLMRDAEVALKTLYKAPGQGGAAREAKQAINYNLAELNCATGDELQFQLVSKDLLGQSSRSEPLSFTVGSVDKAMVAQLAVRIRQLVSDLNTQTDDLQQTRASWLSIARSFGELDSGARMPALTVLRSRLNQFGAEMELIGQRLESEADTNNAPEARFMYRLGTTISAWGRQQKEVLLSNCGHIEGATRTNVLEAFGLGRELFSRALLDLEHYQKVMSVLAGVFETDVLATRCESAQGRYKRGLPVLRGENIIAPLGKTGAGLFATFYEGTTLDGKILEQKVENARFENYAPGGRGEQWSARYEGDITIDQEGEWTLACVADDGVRLSVAGKSLLPAESWSSHPATQYKSDVKLTPGWHPILIEYFQGGGEARLQLLAAKKGEALQEVPVAWLRPPSARESQPAAATNALLSAMAREALKDRVRSSLLPPAKAPLAIAPLTNDVRSETLTRIVKEKYPTGAELSSNLTSFASWSADDSRKAETQADDLTVLSKEARRILREELEKYRWRYEGSAALKEVQNAVEELREVKQELRQLPWHDRKTRTEQEQTKIDVARAWETELQRASAAAAHELFEKAKQKDATLAARVVALNATSKLEKELQPALDKLGKTLEQNHSKDEMAGQIEQRLNEINDRYRELNDLQEKLNREEVASTARRAVAPARTFDRAQKAQTAELSAPHEQMRKMVDQVARAERVAGDYQGADRLEKYAGATPEQSNGKETLREVRELATRTDRNIASLAQSIPPPMRQESQSLEQGKETPPQAANALAKPRLAMTLESVRLHQQGDRKTAAAYGLLGEDLGALMDTPEKLTAPNLQPLADRAAALAGEKGEEARQAEIRAANERARQLAESSPKNPQALANQLEEMSVLARQAAGDGSKRPPLNSQLGQTSKLAPPVPDWHDSTDPAEIAASAAQDSANEIQGAPNQWESYNDAAQQLSEAAKQIQMNEAAAELANLNPYASPESASDSLAQGKPGSADQNGDFQGNAGSALSQAAPKGIDQAEWAKLNERLRQAIRSSGIESFAEEHQAAIRAYFERLSVDSQKGKPK